jgi:hypothetical protein
MKPGDIRIAKWARALMLIIERFPCHNGTVTFRVMYYDGVVLDHDEDFMKKFTTPV